MTPYHQLVSDYARLLKQGRSFPLGTFPPAPRLPGAGRRPRATQGGVGAREGRRSRRTAVPVRWWPGRRAGMRARARLTRQSQKAARARPACRVEPRICDRVCGRSSPPPAPRRSSAASRASRPRRLRARRARKPPTQPLSRHSLRAPSSRRWSAARGDKEPADGGSYGTWRPVSPSPVSTRRSMALLN